MTTFERNDFATYQVPEQYIYICYIYYINIYIYIYIRQAPYANASADLWVEDCVQADAALPRPQGLQQNADVVVPNQGDGRLEGVGQHAPHAGLRAEYFFAIAPAQRGPSPSDIVIHAVWKYEVLIFDIAADVSFRFIFYKHRFHV